MPAGVPVATVAVGAARNAGLLAVRILGAGDPALRDRMTAFQQGLRRGGPGQGGSAAGPPRRGRLIRSLLSGNEL